MVTLSLIVTLAGFAAIVAISRTRFGVWLLPLSLALLLGSAVLTDLLGSTIWPFLMLLVALLSFILGVGTAAQRRISDEKEQE